MPNVDAAEMTSYLTRIFEALGAPTEDADNVASHLVDANLKGHDSHGVIRASQYVARTQEGRYVPGTTPVIEQDTATTTVVNGNWNYGQVVGRFTMDAAITKARDQGVAVAVAHRGGHAGRIGAYGEQAAAAGMIAIACVNLHGGGQLVAPFGGGRRRLGTNPIVFAAPTPDPDAPFVLDMATSVGAEGKVRVARNRGAELQPGWILDGEGRPSTDPLDLYGGDPAGSRQPGALLPVGGPVGYKGFGLSMAVEFLAGALLPTVATRPDDEVGGNAIFMTVIDPEHFAGTRPVRAVALEPHRDGEGAAVRRGLRRGDDGRGAGAPPQGRAPRERLRPRGDDVEPAHRGGRLRGRRPVRGGDALVVRATARGVYRCRPHILSA